MRRISLNNKTGFKSILPFEINDTRGILFYSSDFTNKIKNGKSLEFNLPSGEYLYNGSFIKLDSPVKIQNVILPPKERNISYKRYEIKFGNNPNKCTIFYNEGLILFDNSFLNKPLYIKYMIYYHELGHHWYVTESKADLYAAKKMLELGFNPSQIQLAVLDSLSEKSINRMEKIVNQLTKNEG